MDATPFGQYQLQELIGRGGMGEVYRAFDTRTDRVVALKVLPSHLAKDAVFQQRFRRESQAAAGRSGDPVAGIVCDVPSATDSRGCWRYSSPDWGSTASPRTR